MIRRSCAAALLVLAMPVAVWAEVQATFHVAPNGSDENPGSAAKPFATIEKARQSVRSINKAMTGDIVVLLHGGVYPIQQPLTFDAGDSGTGGHNVIYRAAENESPLVNGGKAVVGWKADEKGRWKAPSPVDDSRQLYVNGRRAIRAAGKPSADLKLEGDDGYTTNDVGMADWKNPGDIEFCYVNIWANTRCKVSGIRREGQHAVITMLQPHFNNAKAKEGVNIANQEQADRIWIENALELLDEPGEWYLDRATKTIYYLPRPGEDMTKAEVIVPALERLVELRGTLDHPVCNVHFEGVTFAYGSWLLPNKIGLVDLQANFALDWKKPFHRNSGLTAVHNEVIKSPANIICHAAKSVGFDRCTFTRLGGAGVDLEFGSQDNKIVGCTFCDISGTAVQVGDVLKDDHHPDDPRKIVKNNSIVNNFIHDCGAEFLGSVGVFAGYTEGTAIVHNEIRDLPYSGISAGWGWGEEDAGGGNPDYQQPFKYKTPSAAKNNRIEYNHIHKVMAKTDDGAAIYTLGNQPNTIIRGNLIHDCKNTTSKRGWSQGIYLDEGSGFIEITGNLVNGLKPMHYNSLVQDRKATCNEHDNFFDAKPEEHKEVVETAGLEPAYQNLLQTHD